MTIRTLVKAAALVAVGAVGAARADEEKLALEKLPATVKAAVKARFPGAELKGAAKEQEEGETLFEVTLTYKGDKYDVMVEPSGEIEGIEREIFVDALPSAVVKAVKAKHPKAKIEKAEELTDEDGEVSYEVVVGSGKEAVELIVSPKGKIKEAGEEDEDDEKDEKKSDKGEKKGEKGEKKSGKADKDDDEHEKKGEKGEKSKKGEKDKD